MSATSSIASALLRRYAAAAVALTITASGVADCNKPTASTTHCASWKGNLNSSIASSSTDESSSSSTLSLSERALQQRVAQSAEVDTMNRSNPTFCKGSRHVVVVIGVTGGGKSSTANTLRHSNRNSFEVSGSITSVTQCIAFRDYSYDAGGTPGYKYEQLNRVDFRVIDTPGLQDTNRKSQDLVQELKKLRSLAPHGVSAFLVCVPMGRVTEEHEAVLENLVKLFGPTLARHSALVVTSARVKPGPGQTAVLLNRSDLMEQIGKLPVGHFLRNFVEQAGWRLVGVENVLEPYRTQSSLRLHQAVLDTVDANGGEKFQFAQELENLKEGGKKSFDDDLLRKLMTASQQRKAQTESGTVTCRQAEISASPGGDKLIFTVQCEIDVGRS